MSAAVTLVGVPSALGGSLPGTIPSPAGMARAPSDLRAHGLIAQLSNAFDVRDQGDLEIVPSHRDDPDRAAKNRDAIAEFLPRERDMVDAALAGMGDGARLLVIGGDCVVHAGAMAGLRKHRPGRRLALAWFDAHGDANDPSTTPTGNVWGMPLAMILGRGSPELVAACDSPTVAPRDTALIGAQLLDEQEARLLAAGGVAHFGAGMLGGAPGMSALAAWARSVAEVVDGLYIAIDMDVVDGAAGLAVQMPEPDGISLSTAREAVRTLATALPVVGVGITTVNFDRPSTDPNETVEAVVGLVSDALGQDPRA